MRDQRMTREVFDHLAYLRQYRELTRPSADRVIGQYQHGMLTLSDLIDSLKEIDRTGRRLAAGHEHDPDERVYRSASEEADDQATWSEL